MVFSLTWFATVSCIVILGNILGTCDLALAIHARIRGATDDRLYPTGYLFTQERLIKLT